MDRAGILTGVGTAALAVVRVAGPGLRGFCAKHLSKAPVSLRAVHVELRDETGSIIDDPVAALAPDGAFLDLSLHGGAWVVESTIALLRRGGFQIVDGAEFVEADCDPIEREVMRALPRASTELACRCLLAQSAAWKPIAGDWLRFWTDAVYRGTRISASDLEQIAADRALHWLLNPPTVAVVGRPNVGKSSLANRLLAQDRSIVADLPGTTRDWVGETADLDGLPITLVDTPGVRDTEDSIERASIEHSRQVVRSADLVIVVQDATSEPDAALRAEFPGAIMVSNKIDRPGAIAPAGSLATSAVTNHGVDQLVAEILRRFGVFRIEVARARCWLPEQFDAIGGRS